MIFKYICIDGLHCVLFSQYFKHNDFLKLGKITSAGFCTLFPDGSVKTYGESTTLGLQPAEGDANIIQKGMT